MIDLEISDDVIIQLVKDSGSTAEAVGAIKIKVEKIEQKLEEKASDCSVEGVSDRLRGIEEDLKPFRPVGKYIQNNTTFVLLSFIVVICIGIFKLGGLI